MRQHRSQQFRTRAGAAPSRQRGAGRRLGRRLSKTAGRPLNYLRQSGYAGRVYPVNPSRPTVQGERAWASLAELLPKCLTMSSC